MTQRYDNAETVSAIGATDAVGIAPVRRLRPGMRRTVVAATRLARSRRRLRHWPTRGQLRAMALWEGREPCSYLLDPQVNFVPDPLDFGYERELGNHALCFTGQTQEGRRSELVVFSDGNAFDLFGGPWDRLRPPASGHSLPDPGDRR